MPDGYSDTTLASDIPADEATSPANDGLRMLRDGLRTVVAVGWIAHADVLVLQLASLATCIDCREVRCFAVTVAKRTPECLWSNAIARAGQNRTGVLLAGRKGARHRVPRPRIRAMTWVRTSLCPALKRDLPAELKRLAFGARFDQPVHDFVWPAELEELEFAGMHWPTKLERMSFGSSLAHSLYIVTWPKNLKRIHCRGKPCKGMAAVDVPWPESLECLTLEDIGLMNTNLSLPKGLRALKIGCTHGQALDISILPAGLEQLVISSRLNQPVCTISFPRRLKSLVFGHGFAGSMNGVIFPPTLEKLFFGYTFDQPLGHIDWPISLRFLHFGGRFNRTLEDARWPRGLASLVIDSPVFNQPISGSAWPDGLRELCLGYAFNQKVDSVAWPTSLLKLDFGDRFNKPVNEVIWPAKLERLCFGSNFNQPVNMIAWPTTLKFVRFGSRFMQSLSGTKWPATMEMLDVWECSPRWAFGKERAGADWPPGLLIVSRSQSVSPFVGRARVVTKRPRVDGFLTPHFWSSTDEKMLSW